MEQVTSETGKVHFMHLRRMRLTVYPNINRIQCVAAIPSPCGGITVAYRVFAPGAYRVVLTRCRPDERYVRKIGREEAMKKFGYEEFLIFAKDKYDFHKKVMQHIYDNGMRRNLSRDVHVVGGNHA